jgi:N-acyl-D-aspartate/D-glutamate deacylase
MSEEIVIRGGMVVDGTGAEPLRADVALRGGRIAAVGTDMVNSGARVIEAAGRIVAPGFIDIKTHSDWTLPLMPRGESKLRQGVTTEVIGHCGFSCAPVLPGMAGALAEYLGPSAPWLDFVETSFAEYAATYPATSVNRVMLVGHNTLRLMTMGMADRPPEPAELDHMKALLEDALAAGAFGLSSGLFTAPGSYSEGEELVALGAVLKRHGALYFTHLRDESNRVHDAVAEATEFGERTGVHVQIVHIKLSGMDNWGGAERLIADLAAARARGVKIDCDQYPYVAASNPLKNLMPSWLQEGGVEAMLDRLGQRDTRDRLRAEIDRDGLNNFGRIPDWDAIRISISPNQPEQYAGRTMAEIARERGADGFETVFDYIVEDRGQTRVLVSSISEDDVREFVRDADVMVGSDGNSVAPYGITGQGKPHPRFYGAFARVLGRYVRDENLLPVERAIWKMTGAPARALGLADRGRIAPGMAADITVFDPETIAEKATYQDPHQFAVGIEHVLVNGREVIAWGEHTGALPGEMLRRNRHGG